MKTCFKTSKKSLLAGALIFIAALFLTSCENFLKGASIRKDLEEALEIANANPVTIYVEAEDGSGTVTPTQLRLKKKETFELRYKMNDSWRFIKWEVRDRYTKEPVPDAISFYDETAFETKATLIDPKEGQGLEIYAKAVMLPAITKVSPEPGSTVDSYIPVNIYFNIPVDDSDVTGNESIFNYDNISINYNGENVADYFFEKPFFNEDKTILTIMPKAKVIYDYLVDQQLQTLDVMYSFSDNIVIEKDDIQTALVDNSYKLFSMHYKQTIEKEKPQKKDFFISRKEIRPENVMNFPDDDKYLYITDPNDNSLTKADIKHNRTTGKIYIYGSFVEAGSGIQNVTVKEVARYSNTGGSSYSLGAFELPAKYNSTNSIFVTQNGTTEFFIEHEIKTELGAVELTICVSDVCENTVYEQLYVFKVGPESYENFYLYNYKDSIRFDTYYMFDEAEYNDSLTKLYIPAYASERFVDRVYNNSFNPAFSTDYPDRGNVLVPYDELTITCSYNGKTARFIYNDGDTPGAQPYYDDYWVCDLKQAFGIQSVLGLKVTVSITDDIENTYSKEFCYPIKQPSYYVENDKITVYTDGYTDSAFLIYNNSSGDPYLYVARTGRETDLRSNWQYTKIIPVLFDQDHYSLCGPIYDINLTPAGTLNYKAEFNGDPYIDLSEGKCELVVNIADDSWSKFDAVYFKIDQPSGYYRIFGFNYGEKQSRYSFSNSEALILYSEDFVISLYGVKDRKKSAGVSKTIYKNSDPTNPYDVFPPYMTVKRNGFYNYRITMEDDDSGLDKLCIIKGDGSEVQILPDPNDENDTLAMNETRIVPVVLFEKEAEMGEPIRLMLTDKKGNIFTAMIKKTTINSELAAPGSLQYYSTPGKWYTTSCSADDKVLYISNLEVDNEALNGYSWSAISETKAKDYYEGTMYGPLSSDDQPEGYTWIKDNTFVRISSVRGVYSGFGYYYTNTSKKTSKKWDYMQKLSDDIWLVKSDAPTLVHTIRTDVPYSVCKDWTYEEWELFNTEFLAPEIMDCPDNQKYDVPLDQIDRGQCYVILAYFAYHYGDSDPKLPKKCVPFMTEVMIKQ